jgi:hypothetical protein
VISPSGRRYQPEVPIRTSLRGARCAIAAQESVYATIEITGDRIARILGDGGRLSLRPPNLQTIDMSGYLLLPGLINAHDHLEFALYPRLANPPYRNYIDWSVDIQISFADVIARQRAVATPLRVQWGGIRNLLCGVTTVCHHNPLRSELKQEDFPVRVIQEYGWAHSVALGGDLRAAYWATPKKSPFLIHACEGVDERAREELWSLDRLGLLGTGTVLVHGLAIDREGVALMRRRGSSLIVCPSSNEYLFGRTPDLALLGKIENLALGSDSPLTAQGDLLDEIRFAIRSCNLAPEKAYRMVTEAPAAILRLRNGEGSISASGVADLIAVRDTGDGAADRLTTLSMDDIEFVMIGGRVHLASEEVFNRLPLSAARGLEPLSIAGIVRWLRAPVKEMIRLTEEVLGAGAVRLGSLPLHVDPLESAYA